MGLFQRKLVACGMLGADGQPTAWARYTPGSPFLTLLSININTFITKSER